MSRTSAWGSLAMFVVVAGGLAAFVIGTGAGSLLGLGYTVRLSLVDSGHVERRGLTKKTSSMRLYERPAIPMFPGEVLEVDASFEGESGRASVSVVHAGWIRALSSEETLATSGRLDRGARRTVRAEVQRSGLHELDVYLHDAVGTVEAAWRVVNPRPIGQLLRFLRLAGALFLIAVLALVVLVTARTVLRRGT